MAKTTNNIAIFKHFFLGAVFFVVSPISTALATTDIEIPVIATVSPSTPGPDAKILQQFIFPQAQDCLNQAFAKAKAPFKVHFKLLHLQDLSAAEEAGISVALETQYNTIEGQPAFKPPGNKAAFIQAIFSDRTTVAHVSPVMTKSFLTFYDSGDAQRWNGLLAQAGPLCEKYFPECNLTAPEKIASPQLKQIAEKLMALGKSYHMDQWPLSNTIYLNSNSYTKNLEPSITVPEEYRPARQFAHESMHAWGGLRDRYYVGANEDNLMSGFACTLDQEQIQQILTYRHFQNN